MIGSRSVDSVERVSHEKMIEPRGAAEDNGAHCLLLLKKDNGRRNAADAG